MDIAITPLADPGIVPIEAPFAITFLGDPPPRVDAAHAHLLHPATHIVHEWRDYTVTCDGAVRLEMGSESIACVVESVFTLRFENRLGLSTLRAFDRDDRPLATRHVEVIAPKLGSAGASLRFLRAMLADLTTRDGAMALLPRAPTARAVQTVRRTPSLLVRAMFLLHHADAIADALALILRHPHRVLDDEREHIAVHHLTDIDPDVVLQLVQGGADWDTNAAPPRLRAAPGGVWFRVPKESHDSAENRFVLAVASAFSTSCDEVLRLPWLRGDDPLAFRRRAKLTTLRQRLERFRRAPLFDDVGPMQRVPSSSRVLQRRGGYRELNALWAESLLAREPVFQRMQLAIDLRDVATLYEYWVWFALADDIRAITGVSPTVTTTVTPTSDPSSLAHGLKATFPGHGTLTYNATRKGYSGVTLKPDYLWEPVQARKVAFDAKFRLAWDKNPLDTNDADHSPVAKAKADDLVKMHAYRDALPDLAAAVVLYPGHVAQFRTVDRTTIDHITVSDLLRGELEGVGAIPMRPEGTSYD